MSSKKDLSKRSKLTNVKMRSQFDVGGSYTGVDFDDKYSKPIQDADDL